MDDLGDGRDERPEERLLDGELLQRLVFRYPRVQRVLISIPHHEPRQVPRQEGGVLGREQSAVGVDVADERRILRKALLSARDVDDQDGKPRVLGSDDGGALHVDREDADARLVPDRRLEFVHHHLREHRSLTARVASPRTREAEGGALAWSVGTLTMKY